MIVGVIFMMHHANDIAAVVGPGRRHVAAIVVARGVRLEARVEGDGAIDFEMGKIRAAQGAIDIVQGEHDDAARRVAKRAWINVGRVDGRASIDAAAVHGLRSTAAHDNPDVGGANMRRATKRQRRDERGARVALSRHSRP